MFRALLYIFIGGGLGSVFRYLFQIFVGSIVKITFPIGTFLVNMVGCFAIGILYGIADRQSWMNQEWRLFFITGICGGFTTFSSFSYESISLLRHGEYLYFGLYVVLSIILGLMVTFFGNFIITK